MNYAVSWSFDLQGRENLQRFAKEVGFRLKHRQCKLLHGLRCMKRRVMPRSISYRISLARFKEVNDCKAVVTKHDYRPVPGYSLRSAEVWLNKLSKLGLIRAVGGGQHIGCGYCSFNGRRPLCYMITAKGMELLKTEKEMPIKVCPAFRTNVADPWRRERESSHGQ
jgi:hypothetical protein